MSLLSPFPFPFPLPTGQSIEIRTVHVTNGNSLSTFLRWLDPDVLVSLDVSAGQEMGRTGQSIGIGVGGNMGVGVGGGSGMGNGNMNGNTSIGRSNGKVNGNVVVTLAVENRCMVFALPSEVTLIGPLVELLQAKETVKLVFDAPKVIARLHEHCKIALASALDLKPKIEQACCLEPLIEAKLLTSLTNVKGGLEMGTQHEIEQSKLDAMLRFVTSDSSIFYKTPDGADFLSCQKAVSLFCTGLLSEDSLPLASLSDLTPEQTQALLLSPDTFRWPNASSTYLFKREILNRPRYAMTPLLSKIGISDDLLANFRQPLIFTSMLPIIQDQAVKTGQTEVETFNSILQSVAHAKVLSERDGEVIEKPVSPVITSSFDIQVSPPASARIRNQEVVQALSANRFLDSAPNSAAYTGSVFGIDTYHSSAIRPGELHPQPPSASVAAALISSRLHSQNHGVPLSSSPHPSRSPSRLDSQPSTPSDPNMYGVFAGAPPLVPASVWSNSDMNAFPNSSSSLLSSLLKNSTPVVSSAKMPSISNGGTGQTIVGLAKYPPTSAGFMPNQYSLFSQEDKRENQWNKNHFSPASNSVSIMSNAPSSINFTTKAVKLDSSISSNSDKKPPIAPKVYKPAGELVRATEKASVMDARFDEETSSPVVSPVTSPQAERVDNANLRKMPIDLFSQDFSLMSNGAGTNSINPFLTGANITSLKKFSELAAMPVLTSSINGTLGSKNTAFASVSNSLYSAVGAFPTFSTLNAPSGSLFSNPPPPGFSSILSNASAPVNSIFSSPPSLPLSGTNSINTTPVLSSTSPFLTATTSSLSASIGPSHMDLRGQSFAGAVMQSNIASIAKVPIKSALSPGPAPVAPVEMKPVSFAALAAKIRTPIVSQTTPASAGTTATVKRPAVSAVPPSAPL